MYKYRNVSKQYGKIKILEDFSFDIEKNKITCFWPSRLWKNYPFSISGIDRIIMGRFWELIRKDLLCIRIPTDLSLLFMKIYHLF